MSIDMEYSRLSRMCRNIRVLHHFEPPTTAEEIRSAAIQYVRKVSGTTKPTLASEAAISQAVEEITLATTRLLEALPGKGEPRTRERERERARARWTQREARITAGTSGAKERSSR
jgi:hypothetical protein